MPNTVYESPTRALSHQELERVPGVLFMSPACHPGAPMYIAAKSGSDHMWITCSDCGAAVATMILSEPLVGECGHEDCRNHHKN